MGWCLVAGLGLSPFMGYAQTPDAGAAVSKGSAASAATGGGGAAADEAVPAWSVMPRRQWSRVPRVVGRLSAQDVGLIINESDPYSTQVGAYYARARGIPDKHILRVSLPVKGTLSAAEFAAFQEKVDAFFGDRVQALALAWRLPFAVECNSITGALTMGFDAKLCQTSTCASSRNSAYFGSPSLRPWRDHGMRLSMLLAAPDVVQATALIDRGVKADSTAGLKGGLPARVHFVTTSDRVRSVRERLFPPAGPVPAFGLDVSLDKTDALRQADRVIMYLTGAVQVPYLNEVKFLPGALADHLTSFGGLLDRPTGQMTVLSWIQAGATASYGTTSEPCAHLQKFPHPQALLLFYVQGATAIEAYWRSVQWPQQGLFVGEPLAAPFAPALSPPGAAPSAPAGEGVSWAPAAARRSTPGV